MKSQNTFAVLGILAVLVLALNLVSATFVINSTLVSGNVSNGATSSLGSITIGNSGTQNITILGLQSTCPSGLTVSFGSINTPFIVGTTQPVSVSATVPKSTTPNTYSCSVSATGNSTTSLGDIISITVPTETSLSISLSSAMSKTTGQATITLNNNGNVPINNLLLSNTTGADFSVAFPASISLSAGQSQTITITSSNAANVVLGKDNNMQIKATGTLSNGTAISTSELTLSVPVTYCSNGTRGNLSIDGDIEISNIGAEDDEIWAPLDNIKIEFDVKNDADDSISSVYAKVLVLDKNGKDVTSDFDFEKEKLSLGTVKDGDSKTATFTIPSLPASFDDGEEFTLYFKAYKGSDEQCADNSATASSSKVSIDRFDRAIIVKESELLPININCGQSTLDLNFDIFNVGTEKEENILVVVTIPELKISQSKVLTDRLSVDKSATMLFNLPLPTAFDKTAYEARIVTYFNYNEDDEYDITQTSSYDSNSESDLDKDFIIQLKVIGACAQSGPKPTIAIAEGQLPSEISVGKEIKITGTIKNNGINSADYVISPSGQETWANNVAVQPSTLTVPAGQTLNFTISLTPTKEGTQTFTIKVISNNQIVAESGLLTIKDIASSSSLLDKFKSQFGESNSNVIYIIVAIFIILILLVIILIAKIAGSGRRKRSRRDEDDEDEDEED